MYLTCTLLQQSHQHGYSLSCPKRKKLGGPDILVEYGDFRIWIEAVTATNGAPTKPDSLAKPERGQEEYTIPDERIILRYTTALYEKHKKYLEYRAQGIVTESDAYVIAVNGFPLSYKLRIDTLNRKLLENQWEKV